MVFKGGFETHGIFLKFSNPRYFTEVLKPMIFNRGSKRLFLRFKKKSRGTHPHEWFSGENYNPE